jgi:hypothetical protein
MLRIQAEWCARLGSSLYGLLCSRAADDAAAGGPTAAVLEGHEDDRPASALALRLMGAVHRLVLMGEAPALARFYPSVGGDEGMAGAWQAFRALLAERRADLRVLPSTACRRTRGRPPALAPGFPTVAGETASALHPRDGTQCVGLNPAGTVPLRDRRARLDPARPSPAHAWETPVPLFATAATVAERAGCDPSPVDPTTDEGRLTLMSYVWPDQRERFALLSGAIEVARRVPADVERASAVDWLPRRLAAARAGVATVVFHSIAIAYLERPAREQALGAIADAGARATGDAPVAWLRMEPGGEQAEVRLTVWPGGDERLVATTGFHGRGVRWLA